MAADPSSLKEIASKVEGKQLLSDGRPIMITADFLPSAPPIDISLQIMGSWNTTSSEVSSTSDGSWERAFSAGNCGTRTSSLA